MKRLRHFFFSRQLREKILLLAFVLLGVAIWVSELSDRVALRIREIKLSSMELDMQHGWLSRKAKIESDARAALESWDPKKTYSAVRLNSASCRALRRRRAFEAAIRLRRCPPIGPADLEPYIPSGSWRDGWILACWNPSIRNS
jgi:hypothetical protein